MKKLALVVLVLALAGCSSSDGVANVDTGDANYNTGKSYTNYLSQDRSDIDTWTSETDTGDVVTSDDLVGDVVVLNFWYAACSPCRTEAPVLESIAQKYADKGVKFYGVNVRDKADTAAGFTKEYGVSYPSLMDADTGNVQFAYASASPVTATPTTLVIDKNGRVAARILGELDGSSLLDTFISDALAEAD